MNAPVAFIGTGNMGGAIIRSVCRALPPEHIYITDHAMEKARELAGACGCKTVADNTAAVETGDYIFLCVKPQILPGVLKEISPVLERELGKGRKLCLVSIAAGVRLSAIRAQLPECCAGLPIIRIMPNLTVSVGKGMLALAADGTAAPEHIAGVKAILAKAGRIDELGEGLMDQFTAIAGCLPAYVFMFLEALADGAVITGLPRAQAMEYAAQTIAGCAEMYLESKTHPGELKDAVCSPAGSTIAGLAVLERCGFRSAAIEAIVSAYQRNQALGK